MAPRGKKETTTAPAVESGKALSAPAQVDAADVVIPPVTGGELKEVILITPEQTAKNGEETPPSAEPSLDTAALNIALSMTNQDELKELGVADPALDVTPEELTENAEVETPSDDNGIKASVQHDIQEGKIDPPSAEQIEQLQILSEKADKLRWQPTSEQARELEILEKAGRWDDMIAFGVKALDSVNNSATSVPEATGPTMDEQARALLTSGKTVSLRDVRDYARHCNRTFDAAAAQSLPHLYSSKILRQKLLHLYNEKALLEGRALVE